MGLDVVRPDRQRPIEAHDRRGRPVEPAQRRAAVVEGLGEARIERERAIVDVDRLGVAAQLLQDDAEIAQCIHRLSD